LSCEFIDKQVSFSFAHLFCVVLDNRAKLKGNRANLKDDRAKLKGNRAILKDCRAKEKDIRQN